MLREAEGEAAVRRFRDWNRLDRLDRPLIVMVGGAAGVGKSTLATMLAHRLGITRVIATDVIRQVLRAFFTHEAMPVVHHSAFEVDLAGFEEQAELVGTGIEAIVERAGAERTPIVVEGVHAVPGTLTPALRGDVRGGRGADRGGGRGGPPRALRAARRRQAGRALPRAVRGDQGAAGPPRRRARATEGVAVIDNTGADETLRLLMGLVLDAVGKLEEET